MPKTINSVELQGHLGKDPQFSFTPGRSSWCRFSLATTDRRKNKQTGEWEDGDTHWHNISAFNATAEWCRDQLSQGVCANVKGKITYSKKDEKQYTNILAFEVSVVKNEK